MFRAAPFSFAADTRRNLVLKEHPASRIVALSFNRDGTRRHRQCFWGVEEDGEYKYELWECCQGGPP
jgi:hypothetical protein